MTAHLSQRSCFGGKKKRVTEFYRAALHLRFYKPYGNDELEESKVPQGRNKHPDHAQNAKNHSQNTGGNAHRRGGTQGYQRGVARGGGKRAALSINGVVMVSSGQTKQDHSNHKGQNIKDESRGPNVNEKKHHFFPRLLSCSTAAAPLP